jgi:membrane protein insertase Oxa1/YidC/SpoIIIJ
MMRNRIIKINTRPFSATPVGLVTEAMNILHDPVTMPWGLTIIATTVLFRGLVTFPIAFSQQKRIKRYESIKPLIKAWKSTTIKVAHQRKVDYKPMV